MLTELPATFQRLTAEDEAAYGEPALVHLRPPAAPNEACQRKLSDWIAWRGASFPAKRHSEYLYRPDVDCHGEGGPKILVSAVMATPTRTDSYLDELTADQRRQARGAKAMNLGYAARRIQPAEHARGIWEIIHSTAQRQGKPIAAPFADRPPDHAFPSYQPYGDPRFDDICCGVLDPGGALVAYLLGKRVGDHVQYDEIMGHADHIGSDVMYLLHLKFVELCSQEACRPQWLNYGAWYSGANPFSPQGGLNRWKRKVNFKPAYLILASS